MFINKFTTAVISVIILLVVILVGWLIIFKKPSGTEINTSQASVIKEMRSLQRLETASFTIEKVIDGGTTNTNAFTQFLFGDKILLIAHGQVIAGFDLSQLSENDIDVDATKVTLHLPKPQILTTSLDNTQTRVYDRQKGLLAPEDKDLESKAREAAENSIRDAACKGGILQQASDNARKQLTALLSSLGFTTITIEIPTSSC